MNESRFNQNEWLLINGDPKKLESILKTSNTRLDNFKPNILVVDDDKNIRDVLGSYLKNFGFDVVKAKDGHIALEFAKKQNFDICFIDLMMPGMDGFALMKKILVRSPEAVIVMITGYASFDTAIRAIRDGAHEFVAKPFNLDDILDIVKKVSTVEKAGGLKKFDISKVS